MRHRLGTLLVNRGGGDDFDRFAEAELGLPTPWSHSSNWKTVLGRWELSDVLDAPTMLVRYLLGESAGAAAKIIIAEANRIFEEENTPYRRDGRGGVHFMHDEEFEDSTRSTLAGLGRPRYTNSKDRFESGVDAINASIPDGKTAIRNVFEAAEGLFRIMFDRSPRLTADQVGQLEPLLQKRYDDDRAALGTAMKLLASFKDWIEACHFYRHEAGKPDEIHQPPLELAVHLVSVGAAFIRLLIELDQAK